MAFWSLSVIKKYKPTYRLFQTPGTVTPWAVPCPGPSVSRMFLTQGCREKFRQNPQKSFRNVQTPTEAFGVSPWPAWVTAGWGHPEHLEVAGVPLARTRCWWWPWAESLSTRVQRQSTPRQQEVTGLSSASCLRKKWWNALKWAMSSFETKQRSPWVWTGVGWGVSGDTLPPHGTTLGLITTFKRSVGEMKYIGGRCSKTPREMPKTAHSTKLYM